MTKKLSIDEYVAYGNHRIIQDKDLGNLLNSLGNLWGVSKIDYNTNNGLVLNALHKNKNYYICEILKNGKTWGYGAIYTFK